MTKCYNCKIKIDRSFGSGRFCSRRCANARHLSEKTKKKISISLLKKKRALKEERTCLNCLKNFVVPTWSPKKCCDKKCGSSYGGKKGGIVIHPRPGGGYKPGSGVSKKCWYDSPIAGRVYLQSTYELRYAKYLDAKKIKWTKNQVGFPYFYQDKIHNYVPDFYLQDTDEYIETKGFKIPLDDIKWTEFLKHNKLTVLFNEDIKRLEAILV